MVEPTQAFAISGKEEVSRSATGERAMPVRAILAFVAACAVGKLFAAWATGFAGDEAYTAVISRTLALSYFDHPPLHQWIVHAFAAVAGEGWWLRLPFVLIIAGINVPLYGLTRRLFGPAAALWTLFGFNAAIYFVVWPDGLILPDGPLFLFLISAMWAVAEVLFGPPRSKLCAAALWLAAGLAFGLAGLAKYSAVFAPLSLFGFLAFSPRHRSWLWRPYPYLGAALAFVVFAPAPIWNVQHHWVSFAFQSGRTGGAFTFDATAFARFAAALGAQVALLSPWVGAPLVIALWRAVRSRDPDSAVRFLLWLVAVPLALFTLMFFRGQNPIPHWFNSAWLFAFPLLGYYLGGKKPGWLLSWAVSSAALAAVSFAVYVSYDRAGPFWSPADAPVKINDPTLWHFNWHGLKESAAWQTSGEEPPSFAVVNTWGVGGKAGIALGPAVPVCAFAQDPREFAFLCDTRALLGKDALIVIPKEQERALPNIAAYFERLGPTVEVGEGRGGRTERFVTLTRGYKLLRPYETPYGIVAEPASGH
ncbi:MAG: glycosyltransferase family 39 protein [Rhodomicrobium sp.]